MIARGVVKAEQVKFILQAQEFGKSGEAKFIPITFKEHWEVIRKIDAATNVSYNCN